MIKYLQIAQWFHVAKMQNEANLIQEKFWKQHYNKKHYEGNWSILSLRSINGEVDNILSVHASAADRLPAYENTTLLKQCDYLSWVLGFFQCEKTSVRLMKLAAGAIIKEHRDYELSFEEGEVRFHIPVATNDGVEFYLDDERIIMQAGTCWYLNLSLNHRVINNGNTDRIHLVIDCKVNDWVRNLFLNNVVVQKQIAVEPAQNFSKEDQLKIIEQLRLMNTLTSIELADKMEKEL